MRSVTLIGDSIRMGYQQTVIEALEGTATVWAPEINGGDSNNVRTHLAEWLEEGGSELVHLNCGLHDIKKDFETGTPQVGADTYRTNLASIFDTILASGARLVWATTTPVNETWHHERKGFDRFTADVDAYNAIAAEEAASRQIPVDDLHAVIATAGTDRLLKEDGVHFNDEGCRLLGTQVVECVRAQWDGAA